MRIELNPQEVRWLADLANRAKVEANIAHVDTPHPMLLLRRDNMADLEDKLNACLKKHRERNAAR